MSASINAPPSSRFGVFGWRPHPVCTPAGPPVALDLLPAGPRDPTPIDELPVALPEGATVYADKCDNSAPDERRLYGQGELRLVPQRKRHRRPSARGDALALREERRRIETADSQLAALGIPRLDHVRTLDARGTALPT